MSDAISFMAAPFAMVLLLLAIHSYLGLQVIERDVIFVDISLSQIAALGGVLSHFYLEGESVWRDLGFSLGLCLVGALVLATFHKVEKKISQEVVIGVAFALASGALILVMDQLPHGAEHLKTSMIGNILFVSWAQVKQTSLVYLGIGLVHFIFRHKFWDQVKGQAHFFWDFLFYFLFGVVISFSTQHAGVLVVFSLLVVPAALATRFAQPKVWRKLLWAWLFGALAVFLSFALSFWMDWPVGAGLVSVLSLLFFVFLSLGAFYEKFKSA